MRNFPVYERLVRNHATPDRRPFGTPRINSASWQANGLLAWWPLVPGADAERNYSPRTDSAKLVQIGTSISTRTIGHTAPQFPGTNNEHYELSDSAASVLDLEYPNGLYFSAWVFMDSSTPSGDSPVPVSYARSGANSLDKFCLFRRNTGVLRVHLATQNTGGGSGTDLNIDDPDSFPEDQWVHIAGNFVPSTEGQLWVNGIKKATAATARNGIALLTDTFGIGNDTTRELDARSWEGMIMDVRIYDRCMSDSEAKAFYDPQTRWDLYDNDIYIHLPAAGAAAAGRIMGSISGQGGLAGHGGIAGPGGGLAA